MGKIELVKSFTHRGRDFKIGEIGEVVEVDKPTLFLGQGVYEIYAKFEGHEPIGLLKGDYKTL